MFDGRTYQKTTLLVALGFPGIVFGIVFILNLFVWHAGSANAIPIGSFITVLVRPALPLGPASLCVCDAVFVSVLVPVPVRLALYLNMCL